MKNYHAIPSIQAIIFDRTRVLTFLEKTFGVSHVIIAVGNLDDGECFP